MGWACSMHGWDDKCYSILIGKLKEGDNFRDLGVDGNIIIKWILKKYGERMWN
jgi:hypothetical protein